jgi:hypothetical protein
VFTCNIRRITLAVGTAGGFLFLLMLGLRAQAGPEGPLGQHCGAVGPLPPDDLEYCGCTWGPVLFHGRAVRGAAVTLTFGSGAVISVTGFTELESVPYFDLTAHKLGARRGDMVTLTARFAGQTITRAIRAWPGADGEQHVVLAFSERGVWHPWVTGGYTRALALDGDVVWAGGPAGVLSLSLSSGVSVTHALPWADPAVRALAVGTDGHVWAAGGGGVAEFDGHAWQAHPVPLAQTWRALAVDPATGVVWAGGGDGADGGVATYDGTWQTAGAFPALVTALVVDAEGRAWAGTWREGAYRQDGRGGWTHYQISDGLAADDVLAAAGDSQAVWFGTSPGLDGEGPRGGIARYDLATGVWQAYTTAHGLPRDATFSQSPARVYALALGEEGTMWAGTTDGVRFLAGVDWWAAYTATHGLRAGPVRAIVAGGGTAVAATAVGLDRLDLAAVPGAAPTAWIDVPAAPVTVTGGTTLALRGGGADGDEGGARVVAWDWSSSRDGPLCTAVACALPHALFTPGSHLIALRVQDDEGVWSVPVVEAVWVEGDWRVYLPLVVR